MVRYLRARARRWRSRSRVYPWPPLAVWLLGLVGAARRGLAGRKRSCAGSACRAGSPGCSPPSPSPPCSPTRSAGWRRSTDALDAAGFTLGSRRFTLLALVQIVIGLLALYAVVRLAIRLAGQSIRRSRGLDPTQQLLAQKLAAIVDHRHRLLRRHRPRRHRPDRARRLLGRARPRRRLRPAEDVRQSDRRDHPADGPLDQAGRRDLGRRELRLGQQDRRARRLDRHPRRQGISDPERAADDPGGGQLVLFDPRRAHLASRSASPTIATSSSRRS